MSTTELAMLKMQTALMLETVKTATETCRLVGDTAISHGASKNEIDGMVHDIGCALVDLLDVVYMSSRLAEVSLRAPVKVPSEYRVLPRELGAEQIGEILYEFNRKRSTGLLTQDMLDEIYSAILYTRPREAIDMEARS